MKNRWRLSLPAGMALLILASVAACSGPEEDSGATSTGSDTAPLLETDWRTVDELSDSTLINPANAGFYKSRADAYISDVDLDRKWADITRAIELEPLNYQYMRDRQQVETDIDRYRNTAPIIELSRAIELDPENGFLYWCRAAKYLFDASYIEAARDLTMAIKLGVARPSPQSLYYFRGLSYMNTGEYASATADFTRVLDMPSNITEQDARFLRSLAYLLVERYDSAIADATKYLEDARIELGDTVIQGSFSDYAYWIRGQAYLAQGRDAEALADFKESLATSQSPELDEAIGMIFHDILPTISQRNSLVRQEIERLQ